MTRQFAYAVTLMLAVCAAGLGFAKDVRDGTDPLIVAHRGASNNAPENTLAAFHEAWRQGADAIEGDFRLSRDGHIVCIHDKTTQRTAGVNLTVAKTSLAQLRKLDVGKWKHAKFEGERIATLDEVLGIVPPGKRIFIELKSGPEIVLPLRRVLDKAQLQPEQITIIAFDDNVIAACRKALPNITACWLTSLKRNGKTGACSPTVDSVLKTLKRIGASGMDCKASDCVDDDFVKKLRGAGMQFHCWTVNDAKTAHRFRSLGVDSITTDKPAMLRAALSETK